MAYFLRPSTSGSFAHSMRVPRRRLLTQFRAELAVQTADHAVNRKVFDQAAPCWIVTVWRDPSAKARHQISYGTRLMDQKVAMQKAVETLCEAIQQL